MSAKRDYYEVLGVERSASTKVVSEAYRKLAIKFHPDKNPGDEEAVVRFKEAAEAFEVLSDPEKRSRYERFGHAGVGGSAPHFNDVNDIFSAFGDIFGESVFGDLFGGRGRRAGKGGDVRASVTLDLLEAARGVTKTIEFERHEVCQTCQGTGAKAGHKPERCSYCGGRGQVIQSTGIFRVQATCPSCHGAGSVVKDPCAGCGGDGYKLKKVRREIMIPAGVDDQMRVRLAGEGDPSPSGGPRGDCYCAIHVKEHPLFSRDGQNLVIRVPITYSQAALGTKLDIPTLDEGHELKLPAGTQSGEVFKIRGCGLPHPRTRSVGDLLVQVVIEVPRKLTERQQQLLRELAEVERTHVSPQRKTFIDKVKEYFVADSEVTNTEE